MTRIGPFTLYDGLMVIDANGAVYREANPDDLKAEWPTIYRVETTGLRYQHDISKLGTPLNTLCLQDGKVQFGYGSFEPLHVVSLEEFTGQSRPKGEVPDVVYLVPVYSAVYNPNVQR